MTKKTRRAREHSRYFHKKVGSTSTVVRLAPVPFPTPLYVFTLRRACKTATPYWREGWSCCWVEHSAVLFHFESILGIGLPLARAVSTNDSATVAQTSRQAIHAELDSRIARRKGYHCRCERTRWTCDTELIHHLQVHSHTTPKPCWYSCVARELAPPVDGLVLREVMQWNPLLLMLIFYVLLLVLLLVYFYQHDDQSNIIRPGGIGCDAKLRPVDSSANRSICPKSSSRMRFLSLRII